mmetsp:Transcript_86123/g.180132  ORF Transcript_86123/g.180132 Transcript_86123/m.180132 type:complete len:252 (-) Transcript_86123:1479-2234(-)
MRQIMPSAAAPWLMMQACSCTQRPSTKPGILAKMQFPEMVVSHAHLGRGPSTSNMTSPRICVRAAQTRTAAIVRGRPFQKKSRVRSILAKSADFARATTLEGAAVGSKNASDVAMVAGRRRRRGFTTACNAALAMTGSKVAAAPTFEKTWQHRVTPPMMQTFKEKRPRWGMMSPMQSPTMRFKPDCAKPELMAMPPPTSKTKPKSNLSCTVGHDNRAWRGRTSDGRKNSSKAGMAATVASFTKTPPEKDVT